MSKLFTNGWEDQGSVPGNGVEPSLYHSVVAIEKGAFRSPSTKVANFAYFTSEFAVF